MFKQKKTKGYSGKNATLTPTKTLLKKQDYFPVIFQIALSTYKLDSFFKKKKLINQILKIKTQGFFFAGKKKVSPHARSACDEASIILMGCMLKWQIGYKFNYEMGC